LKSNAMGSVPLVIPFSSSGLHSDIPIPDVMANAVRLTLNKTSNTNAWFSINEITVYGSGGTPIPPPITCAAGEVWDTTLLKCVPIVTPPPATNTTKSGIKLMATPKSGGFNWELDLTKDPNLDAHFSTEGDKCTPGTDQNGVKFYNMYGHKVTYASGMPDGITNRLSIYFDGGKGSTQTATWKTQKGFLWKAGDPVNYVVISTIRPRNSLASTIHHEGSIKNRGGLHSGSSDPRASTVEITHEMKGSSPRWAREYNHPNYDYKPTDVVGPTAKDLGMVQDVWFSRQLISRELADRTGVSYEYWINNTPFKSDGTFNNDTWQLYSKTVDKDGFNS
jgi:hypothetical protein